MFARVLSVGAQYHILIQMRRLLGVLRDTDAAETAPQPTLADIDGLVETVRLSGLEVVFTETGQAKRDLADGAGLVLYRIIQELINNIIKHSNATEVLVQLNCMDNLLAITVEDNGQGFSIEASREGIGLDSIKSRVDYLSGKLDIQSKEGMGTSVYIEFILEKLKPA